jgi:HEAT repeat protein
MQKILKFLMAAASVACVTPMGGVPAAAAQTAHRPRLAVGTLPVTREDPADSMFRVGRQLLNSNDYRKAANLFQQLVDRYPAAPKAEDALYWRAWALFRIGRDSRSTADLDDARATLDRYNKRYGKDAKLATDANDLYASIRAAQASLGNSQAYGEVVTNAGTLRQQRGCGSPADEEMRMAALDGLLSMSSADAVPILKDVLKQRDECRAEMRKKAVFLLSQKRADDIAPTLLDVARNDPSEDVRKDAIFWLSQTRSDLAVPMLDSIVFQSRDDDMRKQALFALSQQSRDERARTALKRAAEDERLTQDVREQAIFWLGQSNIVDLDWFKQLFQKTRDPEIRNKITFAVSQHSSAEASTWLLNVAKDKTYDTDVRKQALFWLGQRRSTTMDMLQSVYDQSKGDDEMQEQVIFVVSQRSDPAAIDKLIEIAKNDPNVEMRKKALFWLGQKHDPRARQFLLDLIKK